MGCDMDRVDMGCDMERVISYYIYPVLNTVGLLQEYW